MTSELAGIFSNIYWDSYWETTVFGLLHTMSTDSCRKAGNAQRKDRPKRLLGEKYILIVCSFAPLFLIFLWNLLIHPFSRQKNKQNMPNFVRALSLLITFAPLVSSTCPANADETITWSGPCTAEAILSNTGCDLATVDGYTKEKLQNACDAASL